MRKGSVGVCDVIIRLTERKIELHAAGFIVLVRQQRFHLGDVRMARGVPRPGGEVGVRSGVARIDGEGGLEGCDGLLATSHIAEADAEVVEGLLRVGVEGDGLIVGCDGVLGPACLPKGVAEIDVGANRGGILGDDLSVVGECIGVHAEAAAHDGAGRPRFRRSRIKSDGGVESGVRFVEPHRVVQRHPEPEVRLGALGIDRGRAIVTRDRLVPLTQPTERVAQADNGRGEGRLRANRGRQRAHRRGGIAPGDKDRAQGILNPDLVRMLARQWCREAQSRLQRAADDVGADLGEAAL